MKFLILALAVWHLATSKTITNQRFKCDTPDEWFIDNGTGIHNFYPGRGWPNGIVKYELDSSLSDGDRQEVHKAFDDIQSKTCIRFQQRAPGDVAFTRIQTDDSVCGLGIVCYTGGESFAKFGGGCRNWDTMVHELGHNLCMSHEQSRKDRDNFLQFNDCAPQDIPAKRENYDLRGSLYDYASRMHYQCGWCPGGWPKEVGASRCGQDIQQGLSVMDADKLNDFYDCGGCLAHRWRPIDALTDADRRGLLQFGQGETGEPYYICRGNFRGFIAIGKYWDGAGICYVPYGGREYQLRTNAQVFTVPSRYGANSNRKSSSAYKLVNATEINNGKMSLMAANRVPCGRSPTAVTGYAAIATIEHNGRKDVSIGGVYENDMTRAYIPGWGGEFVVTDFLIVTCST